MSTANAGEYDGADWTTLPSINVESPAGDGTEAVFSEFHYSARKIVDIYKTEDF
jgi:hypothetical protein